MNDVARLLKDLVSLPSVNPMGRPRPAEITLEHRMTAYLEDWFKKLGVPYERQPVMPQRENIVARYVNPASPRTVVFEAHQDTVPTDGMIVPPFEGKIEGDRLYGRGSCDIKGGMTAMLTAFARLVRDKPRQAPNVIMACTADEEHTFMGVQVLVKRGLKADCAIVAEPTQLNIVHAHKGISRWFMTTPGRACHSSAPEQGVNAIYRMGKLLVGIEQFAERLRTTVVDPLLGPATLSVGMIEGGVSVNTVPDKCRIEIDRRIVGGEIPRDAPKHLSEFLKNEAGIDFPFECEPCWIAEPALMPTGSEQLVERLGSAINSVRGNPRVHSVPYGTDAATISFSGIPAVVFGPGNIAQAHTIDEWVPLSEIETAADILYRFLTSGSW
jgi:acetylornithine deacetylase